MLDLLRMKAMSTHLDNARVRVLVCNKVLRPFVLRSAEEEIPNSAVMMALRVAQNCFYIEVGCSLSLLCLPSLPFSLLPRCPSLSFPPPAPFWRGFVF